MSRADDERRWRDSRRARTCPWAIDRPLLTLAGATDAKRQSIRQCDPMTEGDPQQNDETTVDRQVRAMA
jgi:hypothetical protein